MAKKEVSAIVSRMGLGMSILTALMEKAKKRGLSEEAIHRLATPEGEVTLDKIVDILAETSNVFLELVSTVFISATNRFSADVHFTTGSKEVKIAWIGDNFRNNFSSKVENPQGKSTLRISKLKRNSLDKPILDELRDKAETTLTNIWTLLKEQSNGQPGKLLVNGYANIFYVRDAKGVLWAVSVRWYCGGWFVGAYSATGPHEWYEGYRVFSRNS